MAIACIPQWLHPLSDFMCCRKDSWLQNSRPQMPEVTGSMLEPSYVADKYLSPRQGLKEAKRGVEQLEVWFERDRRHQKMTLFDTAAQTVAKIQSRGYVAVSRYETEYGDSLVRFGFRP